MKNGKSHYKETIYLISSSIPCCAISVTDCTTEDKIKHIFIHVHFINKCMVTLSFMSYHGYTKCVE